jgi:hypothetical protein
MKNNGEAENDAPLTPGQHEQLWQIVVKLPTDVEPWGQREPGAAGDCSCCMLLVPASGCTPI